MAAEQPRVGWIGTGVMGSAMCGHALTAGYELSVFTRTRSSAESLLERGATWRDSPAAVAAVSDVVCSMVGYPADVRSALLGEEGALAGASAGSIVVDFTTSEPGLAREIAAAAEERGLSALDAPVSGGDVGARNGTLVVMVGGDPDALERVRPLIATFAQTIVHTGGPGAGQHTKMVNQVAIAAGMIAVCEALLYAQRAGLDVEATLQTISGGAAGSWSLSNYAPRMLRGDFAPGFKVDHFVKDLGIALGEARSMRLALPGTALAEQLYVALQAQGGGQLGTHALVTALATLNDVPWDAASG
jgi:3-hydroxyisobutyrate dehydrogenase